MNPVVEDWLPPAREHLIQFGLSEAKLLSKGLNNITYPVLSPILRQAEQREHEALVIGNHPLQVA